MMAALLFRSACPMSHAPYSRADHSFRLTGESAGSGRDRPRMVMSTGGSEFRKHVDQKFVVIYSHELLQRHVEHQASLEVVSRVKIMAAAVRAFAGIDILCFVRPVDLLGHAWMAGLAVPASAPDFSPPEPSLVSSFFLPASGPIFSSPQCPGRS